MTLIPTVRAKARQLANARRRASACEKELGEAVRRALAAGDRAADIAEAAGISRQRVYQIRDGKR